MRVLIAEDSVLLRDGLTRLLEDRGHEVVAAVADGNGIVPAFAEHRPDACVLDVRMPPSHTDEGLRAALEIRRRWPGSPLLVLSQYVEERYAIELLSDGQGGLGYLLKDRLAETREFTEALDGVAAGGTALDPDVVRQIFARHRPRPIDSLTPREREVLTLMAEGRSNAAIARRLVVSDGAIEKHVSSIFAKLALEPSTDDHRRVLAVLQWVQAAS